MKILKFIKETFKNISHLNQKKITLLKQKN